MTHLPSTGARPFQLHGVTFRAFTAGAARSLAAWQADFAPATPGQAHTMTEDEILFVVDGELEVEVGDERFTAIAGDAVLVPAGATFRISTTGAGAARIWAVTHRGMTATMQDGGARIVPPWAQ